jgi:hypothetical protein
MPHAYPLSAGSPSFPPLPPAARFERSKSALPVKRIDFPIRPHLLKFLQVHLHLARVQEVPFQASDYALSSEGRFGLPLTLLLQKPVQDGRYEGSIADCTAQLGLDLRNYKGAYAYLLKGKLSPWVVFQFNDLVEETFRKEFYWWVREQRNRRATIKDAIYSYMAFYDVTEEDIAYETLRRDLHRNGGLPTRRKKKKKEAKTGDFGEKVSQKINPVSQKINGVSQKIRVLSQRDTFAAVRQELAKLPLPMLQLDFLHGRR